MTTYKTIQDAIDDGDYDKYDDRVDVTIEISLFDYGIIRNSETNECIFYRGSPDPKDDTEIDLTFRDISIKDIEEYLNEWAKPGFFSFIGSSLAVELDRLENDNLAPIIQSITMYDGYFTN